MPPEPDRPDRPREPAFVPPGEEPEQVQLGLTDILDHLATDAQRKVAAPAGALGVAEGQQREELTRRLETVARLAGELRAELAAVQALRPPDVG